jgi:hypothetical protein
MCLSIINTNSNNNFEATKLFSNSTFTMRISNHKHKIIKGKWGNENNHMQFKHQILRFMELEMQVFTKS